MTILCRWKSPIVTALSLTACETTSYCMELVLKPIRTRFHSLVSRLWRAFVKDEHGSVESGRPRFQCVERPTKTLPLKTMFMRVDSLPYPPTPNPNICETMIDTRFVKTRLE